MRFSILRLYFLNLNRKNSMKLFSNFYLVFCCFILLAGCVREKENVEGETNDPNVMVEQEREEIRITEGNIYQTVRDNESLTFLRDVLRTTGLDSQLAQGGPYTLFAPSDVAFEEMRKFGEKRLPDSIGHEELKEILLHHVVEGNYSATDLANMSAVVTLGGDSLKIIKIDDKVTIDSVEMIFTDREADNGYVHVISEVLIPESASSN